MQLRNGWISPGPLTGLAGVRYKKHNGGISRQMEQTMTESKHFHKALGGLIDARSREATRQVSYRFQHQLIGAVTKRP